MSHYGRVQERSHKKEGIIMKIAILGSWREGDRIKHNYLLGFAENILED